MRSMAAGLGLALPAIGFALLLSEEDALAFDAILLGAIGFVYVGFAVADGRVSAIAVQSASALAFLSIAYYGHAWGSTTLLGAGFLAHAAWDWLHHDGHGPTHVRRWYPPFCAVADIALALPLFAGWV